MSGFMGGSAYSMARDIGEGYFAVTDRTFRKMSPAEINQLAHEIDRLLRELRGSQFPGDELQQIQTRNRKIQRLNSAVMVLRGYRQRMKR